VNPANSDDIRLMALAESIDEGEDIDWAAAEREAASDEERAAVRALRVVAGVAEVCRDPEAAGRVAGGAAAASASGAAIAPGSPGLGLGGPGLEARAGVEPLGKWGPYRLTELLGRGAYGCVYRAVDNLHREVALKLLTETGDDLPADAARVLREGRLLARIRHENVVKVHAVDEFDGRVGLSMDFIEGLTLEEELDTRGVLGAGEATLIGIELCRALAAVHRAGLLHRDVKAQNVMRECGGRIVLMDFGAGLESARAPLAPTTIIAGTPLYLAPELFEGRAATPASDLYSLGVLLFHLVTDAWPIEGADLDEVRAAHQEGRRHHLRDLRSDLPAPFIDVIERALEPQPERRIRTAGELERALLSLGPMIPAPEPGLDSTPASAPEPPRRVFSWKWATVSVLALALAGLGGRFVFDLLRDPAGPLTPRVEAGVMTPAPVTPLGGGGATGYAVDATFYRLEGNHERRLADGDRVRPGDGVGLNLQASRDLFVYVVNEDAAGETYLLFPLPGQALTNPLPPGRTHRLPGVVGGVDVAWSVTSDHGAEHFLVFVSPTRLEDVERTLLAEMPRPTRDGPAMSARLSNSALGELRGLGGLAPVKPGSATGRSRLAQITEYLKPKTDRPGGVWLRQLTLENPSDPSR
jgi:hypothetical protein